MTINEFQARFPVGTKLRLTYHHGDPKRCGERIITRITTDSKGPLVIFNNGGVVYLESVTFTANGFAFTHVVKRKKQNALVYELV